MSIDSASGRPFSFFWLSAEIRKIIYQYLLCARGKTVIVTNSDPFTQIQPIHTAILRTCHGAYLESICVLYEDNTFRWDLANNGRGRIMPTLFSDIYTRCHFKHVQLVILTSQFENRASSSPRPILGTQLSLSQTCLRDSYSCNGNRIYSYTTLPFCHTGHQRSDDLQGCHYKATVFEQWKGILVASINPRVKRWSRSKSHDLVERFHTSVLSVSTRRSKSPGICNGIDGFHEKSAVPVGRQCKSLLLTAVACLWLCEGWYVLII